LQKQYNSSIATQAILTHQCRHQQWLFESVALFSQFDHLPSCELMAWSALGVAQLPLHHGRQQYQMKANQSLVRRRPHPETSSGAHRLGHRTWGRPCCWWRLPAHQARTRPSRQLEDRQSCCRRRWRRFQIRLPWPRPSLRCLEEHEGRQIHSRVGSARRPVDAADGSSEP
jgi:hypothetical protein